MAPAITSVPLYGQSGGGVEVSFPLPFDNNVPIPNPLVLPIMYPVARRSFFLENHSYIQTARPFGCAITKSSGPFSAQKVLTLKVPTAALPGKLCLEQRFQ
jgi:hypothetical protein